MITQTKLAVFGDPIHQSLSPRIHIEFARQFALDIDYQKVLTPAGTLAEALSIFSSAGGMGANITAPLKQEAFALIPQLSPCARTAGTLNTLKWDPSTQQWFGENTDGQGFLQYLQKYTSIDIAPARVLLLGAGGAARALIDVLEKNVSQPLTVVNRDLEKAQDLKKYPRLELLSYVALNQQIHQTRFDIIINATSSSLHQQLPPLDNAWLKNSIVIDLAYAHGLSTPFMEWALSHHAKSVDDGLGMLVEQAALSFALWFDRMPDSKPVYQQLRSRE
ncbi:shikimate dehydrogenase [Candidatus Berkiella cookevillensis]|uniref:Shikimate dehydrogenase (NADP(+)) n=1 Tax=Candidatus Berkiella cookevillensis TaxID=437022 RepID=A0AAE3HLT0_9GAMM|nr:shikimate dehydrogenase [Candidatus Berkiella cookevillensis]